MAISGILVSLDGVVISAAILPVAPSLAPLARPIRASVHLFATIDLQKREIPSFYYTADRDTSPVHRTDPPESAPLSPADVQASTAEIMRRVDRARAFLGASAHAGPVAQAIPPIHSPVSSNKIGANPVP